jgi:hypothetical protein
MSQKFRSQLILPDNKVLFIKEMTLGEQINLTKSIMQEEVLGLQDFLSQNIQSESPLSITDLLLGLIYCREISAGGSLFLTKDNATYEIPLDRWKNLIYAIYARFNHTSFDGLDLKIECCEWKKYLSGDSFFQVTEIDGKPVQMDLLPVRFYHTLRRHLNNIRLPEMKLLEPFNTWSFNFQLKSFWYLLSLLFERDLESTYETMFILQKECNINCKDLTPGEFMLYTKHYQALIASMKETPSNESEDFLFDDEDQP